MTKIGHEHIIIAKNILVLLGLPRAQQNDRSALCLLALIDLTPDKNWIMAESPLIGITPIMDWVKKYYQKNYKPNTRETFRRQTMHQFLEAGISIYNPDDPARPVNSPKTVYQIEPTTLELLKSYDTPSWNEKLEEYLKKHQTLSAKFARARKQKRIPVQIAPEKSITLSPGKHSELIRAIIEDFAPRFAPGCILLYAGDTEDKWAYLDKNMLSKLNVTIDSHGKMPDVALYDSKRNWLLLVESVTSHGPIDGTRHSELSQLFANATAGLVYITAFPNRNVMKQHISEIAWETEVWIAEAPSHLIHFNGERFLGPHL